MISPSIRTFFVSSSTFSMKITQTICILLLLSHISVTVTICNAAILVPATDDTKTATTTTTTTTTAIDNVNNNVASAGILEKNSQELTNQSALARKFDDIDLMPSIARTFLRPLQVYMNPVVRQVVRAYTTFQWWEPEVEFGSCMIEQRYNVNAKEMARSTMLNIIQMVFNKLRELFSMASSMVSFESGPVEEQPPPIDFSYYERHPSINELAVHAAQAAVEHQINTQVPTRPPPIKFIPPRFRPSFGGLLDKRRRRQGRTFTQEVKKQNEAQAQDENYDKDENDSNLNIVTNSENNKMESFKRIKRYRRQTIDHYQRSTTASSYVHPSIRRQYYYNKPSVSPGGGGINPAFFNHVMTSPQHHVPTTYNIQYTPHQMQQQQNNQQLTYQEFHLPEDQPVDDYKGTFDAQNYVDTSPISVDLQTTYSNWVDDFETLILNKFGLAERANTKSTGNVKKQFL